MKKQPSKFSGATVAMASALAVLFLTTLPVAQARERDADAAKEAAQGHSADTEKRLASTVLNPLRQLKTYLDIAACMPMPHRRVILPYAPDLKMQQPRLLYRRTQSNPAN